MPQTRDHDVLTRIPRKWFGATGLGGWCLSRGGHPVVGPVAGGSAGDAGAC